MVPHLGKAHLYPRPRECKRGLSGPAFVHKKIRVAKTPLNLGPERLEPIHHQPAHLPELIFLRSEQRRIPP